MGCGAADLSDLLRALATAGVRFVVIGGVALQLQGSSYTTFDLDIAYERTRPNAARLAQALAPFKPRPRDFPPALPFICDAQMLLTSEVLTLQTTAGDLDLLGAVKGIGGFDEVENASRVVNYEGFVLRVLSIDGLILAKKAAGRPKDRAGLMELEALREAHRIAGATEPREPDG